MIAINIEKLTVQDLIDLERKIFQMLPREISYEEIKRAKRMIDGKPTYILETPDGTSIKACTLSDAANAIEGLTGNKPDISNVYKLAKGKIKTVYGITLRKFNEGE